MAARRGLQFGKMMLVNLPLANYQLDDVDSILTPALLVYPHAVEANIRATLKMVGNNPDRWRPHIKTAKIPSVLAQFRELGIRNFKCSTTLELLVACESGAADVLLAYPVMGANARRTRSIAEQFPNTRISVLIESTEQWSSWQGTNIGIFIDVNPGMNRTGIDQDAAAQVLELAKSIGTAFRGLHYYDGQVAGFSESERESRIHNGYDHLLRLVDALHKAGIQVGEVITSGTPAAPFAMSYTRFSDRSFIHRISPGTVVYNDATSLDQLPGFGYQAAVLVLATVVSRPTESIITCDAGHKSVSADAGVPTCAIVGHEDWRPGKPSEEHLPIQIGQNANVRLGDKIYLLPRHVCPTVNNFDEALLIRDGKIRGTVRVAARGHEMPLIAAAPASPEPRHAAVVS